MRMLGQVAPLHAAVGAMTFLSYRGITHLMRLHDHTNRRPFFVDHVTAFSIIGGVWGLTYGGSIKNGLAGFIGFGLTLAPMCYWLYLMRRTGMGHPRPSVIYENEVTKEDVARYEAMDQEEMLAFEMMRRPGYGIIDKD